MDAPGPGRPMTDSAVEREIQTMLAVDPSPAFLPRLRGRIADEPRPAAWWMSWRLPAAAGAAALIIVGVRIPTPRQGQQAAALLPSRPLSNALVMRATSDGRVMPIRVVRVGIRGDGARSAAREVAEHARAARTPDPEVLLDPRESAALRALIVGVRSGTVSFEPIVRASLVSTADPPPLDDIAIPAISIDPLAEGARP